MIGRPVARATVRKCFSVSRGIGFVDHAGQHHQAVDADLLGILARTGMPLAPW